MPFVLVYINDLLIITKGSYKQHLEAVAEVLKRLMEVVMQLHVDKSHFAKQSVEYLGYIVSRDGIRPQPSKVQIVVDMPRPKTVT